MSATGSRWHPTSAIRLTGLDRLVRNLLDMTRIESGLLKPRIDWCNIRELIDVTLRELHSLAAAHEIIIDFDPDLPLIQADEVLLKQAILNIVLNALIHTPVTSRVTIHAHRQGAAMIGLSLKTMGRVYLRKRFRISLTNSIVLSIDRNPEPALDCRLRADSSRQMADRLRP